MDGGGGVHKSRALGKSPQFILKKRGNIKRVVHLKFNRGPDSIACILNQNEKQFH